MANGTMWSDAAGFSYIPKVELKTFINACQLPGATGYKDKDCGWEEKKDMWEIINTEEEYAVVAGAARPLTVEKFPALKMGTSVGISGYGKMELGGDEWESPINQFSILLVESTMMAATLLSGACAVLLAFTF